MLGFRIGISPRSIFFILIPFLVMPGVCQAGFLDYLKGYNLGINLINAGENTHINFDLQDEQASDPVCQRPKAKLRCQVGAGSGSRGLGAEFLNGFGVFIEQPFRRQGFWYFNYDLGLSASYLSASEFEEKKFASASRLNSIAFKLLKVGMQPYLQFGITPSSFWPDIIITFGPQINTVVGTATINEETERSFFVSSTDVFTGVNPLGYAHFMFELVFWRFGDGFLSFYSSRSGGGSSVIIGDFYSSSVDGMEGFEAQFWANEIGFKVLTKWP